MMETVQRSRRKYLTFLVAMALVFSAVTTPNIGCSRNSKSDEDESLARVEDQAVTINDLSQKTNMNLFSLGEAAERWIDDQVLLQHAQESELIDERSITRIMNHHEQVLLSRVYLDSLLLRYVNIDQERIREYYANNNQDFQFQDQAALVTHISFRREEAANEALRSLRELPAKQDSILNSYNYDHQIVYRQRVIPELGDVIFQAELNKFYGPIASSLGYHLLFVDRFFNRGETIPFRFVRRRIHERLFQMELPLARLAVLDSLRELLDIEVYHD